MIKIYSILAILIIIISLVSCGTSNKIATLKPEPDDAKPLVYESNPSVINLPIAIKIKDIENQTNQFLTGLIYEDTNIEDDDYTVKIWKLAPITLSNVGGEMQTILPLKAIINYRIGTNKLGINLYNTREITLNGKITLLSEMELTNWKLHSKTKFQNIDWIESPSMSVAGKNMPITYLIEPAIKLFKSKLEKSIDDAIKKSVDFKPNVLDALQKICVPTQINTDFDTWLRIQPIEIYATNAILKNASIEMQMGLKCNIETLIGQQPSNNFDRNKIVLKPVEKIPNAIEAHIVAVSTYADASNTMNKNFKGKEFGSDGKKITVQNVTIWHKNNKMIISLEVLGSVNGTIYLNGNPKYNPETKEIFFENLDYVLDTKNRLLKTANWLAAGLVLKKLQQSCRYSIKPNLDQARESMLQYLKNYSPMAGVYVNGTINEIVFDKVQLTNQAILAFLDITGKISVSVDGLK